MKKRKVNKSKTKSNTKSKTRGKHGIRYHIKHKSRLTSLLLIKVLLVFFSFGVGLLFYVFTKEFLGTIFSAVLSFAVVCMLYLFLVIKVLRILKF